MGLLGFLFLDILFIALSLSGFIGLMSPHIALDKHIKNPHEFLRGEKVSIKKLTLQDIIATNVVSVRKATAIYNFLLEHPLSSIKDLEKIPGIGPKTIEKLKFYIKDGGEGGI